MNITEDQAREILSPYQDDIRKSIVSAWENYHAHCREIKHILSSRSRASIIFDLIVDNVRQVFQGKKDVHFSEKKRLFLVNFGDKVVVRFKKLKNNKASCIPTQQTLNFFSQQLEFPEIPNPERLVVGYQLNSIQTELKDVSVIYPKNYTQNFWSYNLEPFVAPVIDIHYKQTEIEQEITIPKKDRIIIKGEIEKGIVKNE